MSSETPKQNCKGGVLLLFFSLFVTCVHSDAGNSNAIKLEKKLFF